jgi:hypothetical protein
MNHASILNTLADNLHSFVVVAHTLKNNPSDIRKTLVEKRAHWLNGQTHFCVCIWAFTSLHGSQISGHVNTVADALEKLRKVAHAKNYLCGKQQAVNDAHDKVDSAIRGLQRASEELRRDAVGYAMASAVSKTTA